MDHQIIFPNYAIYQSDKWSQDSPVGIATGYGLDNPGSIPGIARFFFSS
jgi:hypothetical protein